MAKSQPSRKGPAPSKAPRTPRAPKKSPKNSIAPGTGSPPIPGVTKGPKGLPRG